MSTHDLPQESELIVKSRKSTYCARRRLNGADLTTQDNEDMIQAATLACWKHHREARPIPFCFVCARQSAERYFYRNILGRNPRSPLSLDGPLHDGGDLPHEWLTPASPIHDSMLRLTPTEPDVAPARQAARASTRKAGVESQDDQRTWGLLR